MLAKKIFTIEQVRAADEYTIKHEPIGSLALMERAAFSFVLWFIKHYTKAHPVKVFCGPGNNGGDGLAIARLLHELNYFVIPFLVRGNASLSIDCQANLDRLPCQIHELSNKGDLPPIDTHDVIIDALFGSGISRPITDVFADVIQHINSSESSIIAVDIASGLFSDKPVNHDSCIVKPSVTLSFQLPKLAFFLAENEAYVGTWHILNIGIHFEFIKTTKTNYFYLTKNYIDHLKKDRKKFTHKGTYGHALIIAGSMGKIGAAVLAAKACLRTGVGLLSVHVPTCGYNIMQTTVPEAMTHVDISYTNCTKTTTNVQDYTLGIGPGLGQHENTVQLVEEIILAAKNPIVVDADALNIISKKRSLLSVLPKNSILTPHPREFERLVGKWKNDYEKVEKQQSFSQKYSIYTVLKGAHTSISTPEGAIYFNTTGNPGMATGGSGDVLTGIITALLSQGYSPCKSAILGTYLHGEAGDFTKKMLISSTFTANDIIEHIKI